ncbi:hypothetical protein OSI08_27115, partial [Mycobacterium ulcerans]
FILLGHSSLAKICHLANLYDCEDSSLLSVNQATAVDCLFFLALRQFERISAKPSFLLLNDGHGYAACDGVWRT